MNARNRIALATSALKRSKITGDLPEEAISKLAASVKFQEFEAPTLVSRAGSKASYLRYVITGGISRHAYSATGEFVEFETIGKGQWGNWQGAFVEEKINFDTWSSANASYLAFSFKVIQSVAMENPEILVKILKLVSSRLSRTMEYILVGSLGGDDKRLAQLLYLKCTVQSGSGNIQLATTQLELGKLTGISRQKVSKILKSLQANNLIKIGYGTISILDADKLKKYMP
jgi:CRP/FNR family cyclic AMP-dependent transcriptional regulator